ncbi:uncharacterized protein LAJ45_09880 [Morchella importuna]|uniref:uncharacterized protein n=1 Tax=Morchella importuna TaxID=1174673 RepID=UPI001E8CD6A4|nr:uncharacterized protein LAJ45_09880 [Morchella importuna]KAH8146182.1 hypothetical protein LAJ45_09880 [Morchella importuna]
MSYWEPIPVDGDSSNLDDKRTLPRRHVISGLGRLKKDLKGPIRKMKHGWKGPGVALVGMFSLSAWQAQHICA